MRYIIATSLSFTPGNKDKLRALFDPFCRSTTNDIYGREDLNNLLGQYPQIEKRHYKLWLTSAIVLECGAQAIVMLRNSSVRDFLEHALATTPTDITDLCASAVFFDQCITLWRTVEQPHQQPSLRAALIRCRDVFWGSIRHTVASGATHLMNNYDWRASVVSS